MAKVLIIDYGAGNILSVARAFRFIGAEVDIINDLKLVNSYTHIVLPGVGSFHHAMRQIKDRSFDSFILTAAADEVPLLGICLGMQLLAKRSSEEYETEGLGLICGGVDKFKTDSCFSNLKVPHVGFSSIQHTGLSPLFKGLPQTADFYFTHSYRLKCQNHAHVAATAEHGEQYVAAVQNRSVFGTQFHPEKSQSNGIELLKNFLDIH